MRDHDGLGATRAGGGGGLNATFVNTINMSNVDNRDPAARRQQRATVDFRHASRRRGSMDETKLLTFASTVASRSAFNRTSQPHADLRADLRKETNSTIQAYNRQTRSEILRLAQADAVCAAEQTALSGIFARMQRAMETPDRMIWLADRSMSKRGVRCIQDADDGGATAALQRERQTALRWRDELLDRIAATRTLVVTFKTAQNDLKAHLRVKKRGIDLNPDAYSGVATQLPVPMDDDPPCLVTLADMFVQVRTQRESDEEFLMLLDEELAMSRKNLDLAIKEAVQYSRNMERELVLAKGRTRLAHNKALRDKHLLEIKHECNEGPMEGSAYVRTSERVDRPMVRKYEEAVHVVPGQVTLHETSDSNAQILTGSQRVAANDASDLSGLARALSATLHDRGVNRAVDQDIGRFRKRLQPGRRP